MSNLQILRNEKGLSQSKLSEITGISIKTIQMYEQGHREISNARIDILLKFCIALDCKLEQLICPKFENLYSEYNKK